MSVGRGQDATAVAGWPASRLAQGPAWGGGSVRCYTPDGALDHLVELPADNVTSCAFGGADGTTLFITTAQAGEGTTTGAGEPGPGHVIAYPARVAGAPVTRFAG